MGQRSGFFNALPLIEGNKKILDRKYNANDYNSNLNAIISNGVLRSGDNDLKVTASGGMGLNINIGRAWIKGHWYINDTVFTDFTVPTAPVGDRSRIDRVVLRLNETKEVRDIYLVYLTGEVAQNPTPPTLTRDEYIYDIALADIKVHPLITSISQNDIADMRADKDLCGWVTTPIGYDDYFEALDSAFHDWFKELRNELAVTTLFKEYKFHKTLESQTNILIFNIPQYDPSGVDIVKIYVNGILEIEGNDYTLENNKITFKTSKIVGTDIDVFVYKSIDGEGLGSVSDEITSLQNQVGLIKNIGEYIYICNGVDDNVQLSKIAKKLLEDNTFSHFTINIYGKIGLSVPVDGDGSAVSRYRWFNLGSSTPTDKRITYDFLNCSPIVSTCAEGKEYILFYGADINIKNANVIANADYLTSNITIFSSQTGAVYADSCRFIINAYDNSFISENGTFTNCYGEVNNKQGNSYCFRVQDKNLLRINGGEYRAYTGQNEYNASVISCDSLEGVIITNGMNCPTVAKTSYYQKNAIKCTAGEGAYNDTITILQIEKSTKQNLRGVINLSLPNRG